MNDDRWQGDELSPDGLTGDEVRRRVERGEVNKVAEVTSRRLVDIVLANVFSRLNIILAVLLIVILWVGAIRDALFGFALIGNMFMGTIQELRAKRTLDHLSVLTAPRARVIRDGKRLEIPASDVVLDDVIELQAGDQVVADGTVIASQGLEVDESLLSGESAPVAKVAGDEVLSGSFAVAGTGLFRATRVGSSAYARRLAAEARRFKLASSELRNSISLIVRWVSWLMIPVGIILLVSQLQADTSFSDAISGTVAGIVGMVPQGLALLAALAFVASAVVLGRRNVLVQDLPAIEGLARVDVVCVDKTGTLTEGKLKFKAIEPLGPEARVAEALGALGALGAGASFSNPTIAAIAEAFAPARRWETTGLVPFSSTRKWSAATFRTNGTWVLGAPEVLLDGKTTETALEKRVRLLAESGLRVLLLAHSGGDLDREELPADLEPAALVLLEEKIRDDAATTLQYFYDQDVTVKVISGDNPNTVGSVARQAGVSGVGEPVDARRLPEDLEELARIMDERTVFGRVGPEQKRSMVKALQSRGHVVAMTGDGVNDLLALKEADVAIAMGSGAAATKAVSQLVLLDGRFATLPGVVAEGRRVVANIERVANLFLTKVVYVVLLVLAIAVVEWPFPFLPRHFTLIDSLTISTPAFFLSLAPGAPRYRRGFLCRVLSFTLPAGLIAGSAAFAADVLSHVHPGIGLAESRTMATVVLGIVGLRVLTIVVQPVTRWRVVLVLSMAAAFGLAFAIPLSRQFFALDLPGWPLWAQTIAIGIVGILLLEVGWRISKWRQRC